MRGEVKADPTVQPRVKTFKINGIDVTGRENDTILDICAENDIFLPTLCHLEGLTDIGACRLCLVEIKGTSKLIPACTTRIQEGMEVLTDTPRLAAYRRTILELLFSEGNHVCSVCVSNGNCDLQWLAQKVGMDHVRVPYLNQKFEIDASHERYLIDHNRCILCTRCVRVCDEIEGAHTWDLAGRGAQARITADLNRPWGESQTCTTCGKCVQVCPTGALVIKGRSATEMRKSRDFLPYLTLNREKRR